MFVERRACPVCEADTVTEMYSEPYVGSNVEALLRPKHDRVPRDMSYAERFADARYAIDQCQACSALFQRFAPDNALASEYYETWIKAHGRPASPLGEFTHRINEAMILTSFLLRRSGKKSPTDLSVLDFGAGRGIFALAMKACGCNVSVFDLSESRREGARDNGLGVVDYDEIPTGAFDFINTEQVFEHLDNPLQTARHLSSGLDAEGVLKISVPYLKSAERGPFRIDWSASPYAAHSCMPLQPIEHLTYFRRPSLNVMMERLGYREVKLGALDELNYAFDWKGLRNVAKNLSRPWIRKHYRNYLLFARKPAPR